MVCRGANRLGDIAWAPSPKLAAELTDWSKKAHYQNSFHANERVYMARRQLKLVSPATVNRTVAVRRPPNRDLRTREYLTEAEVERLMKAATRNRWGHRDSTMV